MIVQVKTLKNNMIQIEANDGDTVLTLKEKIMEKNPEYVVDRQKLIHGGKVLVDSKPFSELGLTEKDFLVVMVTAAKPTTSAGGAGTASVSAATTTQPTIAPITPPAPIAQTIAPTPVDNPVNQNVAATANVSQEQIDNLMAATGHSDAAVRAALNASNGNADLAFEILMSGGIPQMMRPPSTTTAPLNVPAAPTTGSNDLDRLRQHPQFNDLKRLIQTNPAALPQLLQLLGSQDPSLLAAITANEQAFLAMMNEPITTNPPPVPQPNAFGMPGGLPDMSGQAGLGNQVAMISQLYNSLPPEQRNNMIQQMAQQMNMTPEQAQVLMQMVQMSPEQIQQFEQTLGMGGPPPGAQFIQLTQEEMNQVDQIVEICGCSRQTAVQAYRSCDNNLDIAINFLFNNGGDAAFGGDDGDFGEHDEDDMYN